MVQIPIKYNSFCKEDSVVAFAVPRDWQFPQGTCAPSHPTPVQFLSLSCSFRPNNTPPSSHLPNFGSASAHNTQEKGMTLVLQCNSEEEEDWKVPILFPKLSNKHCFSSSLL